MKEYVLVFVLCLSVVSYGCATQQIQPQPVYHEQFFNYTRHFCSEEDCMQIITAQLTAATQSVNCALYGISNDLLDNLARLNDVTNTGNIRPVKVSVVVDSKATAAEKHVKSGMVYKYRGMGIMHNKYCVIDNRTVITGSFNPTTAAKRDYNNIITINSTALSAFYLNDFHGMQQNLRQQGSTKGKRAQNKENIVVLNDTVVEVYFCPADNCAAALIRELRQANRSIAFAAYSFTNPEIANELIIKASQGANISGIIEKSTTGSQYSKHTALAANGISLAIESSKKFMHHKFFVIDNETVITGSFNPTKNADKRNNENIIVIRNKALAGRYVEEFGKIRDS